LTRMKLEGADFDEVLKDAQRLGYAETEPSLDIDGLDAMHKTGILASLAHGFWVNPKQIYVEGIREITALDIRFAALLGYTIKLLGIVKKGESSPVGHDVPSAPHCTQEHSQPARRGHRALPERSPMSVQVSVYPA